MRKLKSFFIAILIMIIAISFINILCEKLIKDNFTVGFIRLYNDLKNESTFIQKNETKQKNVFMLYGSSELGTTNIPTNPINYFPKKGSNFIVSPVGKGYMQDLSHVIKFLANPDLRGKKLAFIVSLQWFLYPDGTPTDDFQMNFSELQFYEAMKNTSISSDLKKQICKRVYSLISNNSFYSDVSIYTKLYSSNNPVSKVEFALLKPYFSLKCALLKFSNNIKAYKLAKNYNNIYKAKLPKLTAMDDKKDFAAAEKLGNKLANNNSFYMLNSYYNKFIKNNLNKIKGQDKNSKLVNSKEYGDLDLLLKVCKANNIKPLFILMPVNAKYYDYSGIDKSTRDAYFQKTKKIIASHGFDVVDFQSHEYEKYLMEDGMHLGWKGWLYVNKEIAKYYNK
ncbi:D-alanyl-lipoteichoic acid biosynthesis protein DltD [Clostridium neuense]|uniref:D-alanyl-lipoteichoic acid biosynthesis protein DltD n=1 Tax=Clostridium neuense TaxID=1728934 RepID=A0ABW8TA12_9CLOT